MITSEKVETGYATWAEEFVADGYQPYLLTFMFDQMRGSLDRVGHQMLREIERVYTCHLTRVVRKPNSPFHLHERPVWLCSLDRPVFKHVKSSLRDVTVNDGLHAHAAAFYWPRNRLDEDLNAHFESHRDLYIIPGHSLARIDVEPITYDPGYVTGYARKSVRLGRVGEDAVLILPAERVRKTEQRLSQPSMQV